MAEASVSETDLERMVLQIEALFTHDTAGRIVAVNEPDGGPAPVFFLGRTRRGNLWRIRHDLPPDLARQLAELAANEPVQADLRAEPRSLPAMREALRQAGIDPVAHGGPAYYFPAALPDVTDAIEISKENIHLMRRMTPYLEDVRPERVPCLAMIADGAAVSFCFSARLTGRVAEAGLETHADYRGRGYAGRVVAAWARAVRASGRIPLYSTSWDNLASQAVARKLGLIQYGTDLSLGH